MKRSSYAAACSIAVMILLSGAAIGAPTTATENNPAGKVKVKEEIANPSSPLSGKVVETMNSGGYTYVCLEKNGKKTWVAVPEMKVTVGREMAFQPGVEMQNFPSKTLNRTFDRIIFSAGPASAHSASGKQTAPAGKAAAATGIGSMAASVPAAKDVKVEKAAGPDAYTIGEIFEKRKTLDKKTVVVRGKVVKVSAGIMGANWIHLQDGTGNSAKGTHDLVVTSQDMPSVGDVVTLKGALAADKDFGAGYQYTVIIEKASIQR